MSSTERSLPVRFLRVEGAVLLGLSIFLYARLDATWWWFLLVLLPDAGMAGYAGGARLGAWTYNAAHTYLPPAALAVAGVLAGSTLAKALALIWFAHIGMDRMLGYGLKEVTRLRRHPPRPHRPAAGPVMTPASPWGPEPRVARR